MKGVVFNILESFVDESFGPGSFDHLVEVSLGQDIDPYVGPGTYPDEQLFAIINKAIELKKLELSPLLKEFGQYMFTALSVKYPIFMDKHKTTIEFLLTIHDIIHVEIRKLFPEAHTPEFIYSNITQNSLTLKYTSKRKFFDLAEGLIVGAANYFNEKVQINRKELEDDNNSCLFELTFNK